MSGFAARGRLKQELPNVRNFERLSHKAHELAQGGESTVKAHSTNVSRNPFGLRGKLQHFFRIKK